MLKILYVGIGGFIGASLRYLVSIVAPKLFGTQLPFGTLIVNVTGGFLIGLIMELSLSGEMISPNMRLFLTTGILGGLTTFSTFSNETMNYFMAGRYAVGALNTCLNVILSFAGVWLGKMLGTILIK